MDTLTSGLIVLALTTAFLGAGMWIFVGLLMAALGTLSITLGYPPTRIGLIASKVIASKAVSWELAAIPMFIWMGDIIFRTDISQRLFLGLAPLVKRIPGRLLHTNVLGCALFAAISGSSTATCATVGKITIPELIRRGYAVDLASGSLAGAGTFGLLIPPSIAMIIYGVIGEVSIAQLFAAGIVPGLMMAGLYSGYIALRSWRNPEAAPRDGTPIGWREILKSIGNLMPIIILMVIVLGSIYSGLATPSEAAAVGVLAAIIITIATGQFSWMLMRDSLGATIRISAMLCILIASSSLLSAAIAYINLPTAISETIAAWKLSPYLLLFILTLIYIVLGMFIDGSSMTVMTVPIVLPLVVHAGFDPVWYGIYLIIMIEMSAITPPVGLNLYILQGLTGRTFESTVRATVPFFFLLCIGTVTLAIFPEIALWLPRHLFSH
ncbi:TRAP transporter large permease [Shumkonia mesophila]|uniref:TRAP transporter large permease n=1 Tax=Shumkonia mesophila TaxID=2838854 RepID=UPI0029345933|nr:TRAP transporter large permease subunit [Shumkonia mesophila]